MSLRASLGWFVATSAVVWSLGCSSNSSGRCGEFDSCGGDVSGTWNVRSSCVEGDLTTAMNQFGEIPEACRGDYESVVASVTGQVSFVAGTAVNDTVTTVDYVLKVSAGCATAWGVATVSESTCVQLAQTLVDQGLHGSATCVLSGSGCNCTAQNSYAVNDTLGYTVSGDSIVYEGQTDRLDFCVQQNVLATRQYRSGEYMTVFFEADRVQ